MASPVTDLRYYCSVEQQVGLAWELVWFDDDLLEFRVSARNARFAGETLVYVSHDQAQEFARALAGFPATPTDAREFEFESTVGGNSVSLQFGGNSSGAVGVTVGIRDTEDMDDQYAFVRLSIEAAAVDRFVSHFAAVARERAGHAVLLGQ